MGRYSCNKSQPTPKNPLKNPFSSRKTRDPPPPPPARICKNMDRWIWWRADCGDLAPCSEAHIAATKDILADGAPGVSTAHRAATENHGLFFLQENYEHFPSNFIPLSNTFSWHI